MPHGTLVSKRVKCRICPKIAMVERVNLITLSRCRNGQLFLLLFVSVAWIHVIPELEVPINRKKVM